MELYNRNIALQEATFWQLASRAFTPPDDIEIDAWAEQSLELSERTTQRPGLIRLLPYQRRPVNSFKENKHVALCWAAQVGKSTVQMAVFGYIVDQDPGPTMFVYPEQTTAKKRSKKFIRPLLEDSPVLKKHITPNVDDMQLFEYTLDRMDVYFTWSGSASGLASIPIRYLLRDEVDKFAGASDKEADAMSLSQMRTMSYGWRARIFDCSTPTIEDGNIFQLLITGTYEEFHVPCIHCDEMQVLAPANFTYPTQEKNEDRQKYIARAAAESYYRCPHCEGVIDDAAKMKMLYKGDWKARNPEANHVSMHLPTWYAPWVTIAMVVKEMLEAEGNREKMQNFTNSWCALPWKEVGAATSENRIMAHKLEYRKGTIPVDEPVILALTSDIHDDVQYYLVRAHTATHSYLVDYGVMSEISDLGDIYNREYKNPSGHIYNIHAKFVDSGHRTKEVYDHCRDELNAFPIKGNDRQGPIFNWSEIDKEPGTNKKMEDSISLINIHVTHYKEQLLIELGYGFDEDTEEFYSDQAFWFLHADTSTAYAKQMTAETVVIEKDKYGHEKRKWVRSGKNHLFDCEIYQLAARDILREDLEMLGQEYQETGIQITNQDID